MYLSTLIQLRIDTAVPVPLASSPLADIANDSSANTIVLHWAVAQSSCGSRETYFLINLYACYDLLRTVNTSTYDCMASSEAQYAYEFTDVESDIPYFFTVRVGNALGISEESRRSNVITLLRFHENWGLIFGITGGLLAVIGTILLFLIRNWRTYKHVLNRIEIWKLFGRFAGNGNIEVVLEFQPSAGISSAQRADASYVSLGGTPFENSPVLPRTIHF